MREWVFERPDFPIFYNCHVTLPDPWLMRLAATAKKWRPVNRRLFAFLSLQKLNQWLQCSVHSEWNSIAMLLLPRTSEGGLSSLKRAGVCVKAKVPGDRELQRKMWRESVLRLLGAQGNPHTVQVVIWAFLNPPYGVCLKNGCNWNRTDCSSFRRLKTMTTYGEWNFATRCCKW